MLIEHHLVNGYESEQTSGVRKDQSTLVCCSPLCHKESDVAAEQQPETQKALNSQRNLKEEKWSWKNQAPWLHTILQSYSNQDSMVLAQNQKYKSMVQDRKPRDKPAHR